jgi:hypothetical protein
MVYSINDTTEVHIQRTIEGIQRLITIHPPSQGDEGDGAPTRKKPAIEISLAAKRHWESQIKTLQDVPRDADKLRAILKVKQEDYEQAEDSEDIERLVPEIEMLKFVLFLMCRKQRNEKLVMLDECPCHE